ncbi:A/G-specific adenine glycosylase [Polymorphobacter fuscus]|uniref:A/G-specific adenine glycosylase n=1 Tax=Sandarakinorhabdus fusca TaxID=1439888 RepID=UPI001698AC4F|nr:A/G-specific adenine glycosylase [Polymorphobacter fuscus]NJC08159.1 A/G-specific adenine glycosylase [Polymorphobacter fuscus]
MTDSATRLLNWYAGHARTLPWRSPPGAPLPADPDWPYRVWLSEIMLQQTTVAAVQPYFTAFTARWPDVAALAAADDADVMQAWAGLGYYARARNLLACARAVVRDHGGRFPGDEAVLRSLPGIGDYTAAAVAAFGFGRHAIVIDGNVERVTTRLFAIATPLPAARAVIRSRLAALVPAAAGDFAQAMMDLAGRICTPRAPRCEACPLRPDCAAAAAGNPEEYPVKPPRRARPVRHGTTWWIEAGGAVLTVVRPARGLLGGMRALPSCDWQGKAAPPLPGDWHDLGTVSHGFTHFALQLQVLGQRLATRPALDGDWLPISQLDGAGLPTLFAKAAVLARSQPDRMEAR